MFQRTVVVATLGVSHGVIAQSPLWVSQFGSDLHETPLAAVSDGAGGAFLGGYTTGVLVGTTPGREDMFIARVGAGGAQLWLRQVGTVTNHDRATAMAPDGTGGVLVGGYTGGDLASPNLGSGDAVLMRYSSSGSQTWIRQFGTTSGDLAHAVCRHASGAITVAGETWGSLGAGNAGRRDLYLARFDSGGDWIWARQIGTSEDDWASAIMPDGAGGTFVAGTTYSALGGTHAGLHDVVVARYNSAGDQTWIRQFGTNLDDRAHAIAPDGAGGFFVCGRTYGDIGGTNAGVEDGFLVRYDAAGNQLWAQQYGTSTTDWANGLTPDGAGGVFVAGATFGSLGAPNLGSYDAVLARFDGGGNQLGITQFGTDRAEIAYAIASDGAGGVIIGGFTEGDMGGMNAGSSDVFIARFGEAACYADCDGSGALDIFDFLCFQDLFAAHDPAADCDGSGSLDIFDFLCFQDAFAAGCP